MAKSVSRSLKKNDRRYRSGAIAASLFFCAVAVGSVCTPILHELDFATLNSAAGRLLTQGAVRLDNVLIHAVDDASGR